MAAGDAQIIAQAVTQLGKLMGADTINTIKSDLEAVEADVAGKADLVGGNEFSGDQVGSFVDKGGAVYNVKAYGAVGDGVTDDTAAVLDAIAAAQSAGGGRVHIGAPTLVTNTLVLPAKVELHLGPEAILKAGADVHVVQLQRDSRLTGNGRIDVTFPGFSSSAVYLRGATDWFGDNNNTIIGPVWIVGANGNETAILFECLGELEAVQFVRTSDGGPQIRRVEYAVRFVATGTNSWCNANIIEVIASSVGYGFHLTGAANGNFFYGQVQTGGTTKRIVYCESRDNLFDIYGWDWRSDRPGWPIAIELGPRSGRNRVNIPAIGHNNVLDLGWLNRVDNLSEISNARGDVQLPGNSTIRNRFDQWSDVLQQATERHSVTASFAPVGTSTLAHLFDGDPNTQVRCDAPGEQTITVTLASALTRPYLVGVQFAHQLYAPSVALEIYDATAAEWVTLIENTENENNELIGYAAGLGITNVTQVRVRFTGFIDGFTEVRINRLFAYFADAKAGMFRSLEAKDGYRQQLNGWQQDTTVAASQTNVVLDDVLTPAGRLMTGNGSILGLTVNTTSDVSTGSLSVRVQRSTNSGQSWTTYSLTTTTLSSGRTVSGSWAKDALQFNRGDMLRVQVTTTSDFAPTANNLYVALLVEIDTP